MFLEPDDFHCMEKELLQNWSKFVFHRKKVMGGGVYVYEVGVNYTFKSISQLYLEM